MRIGLILLFALTPCAALAQDVLIKDESGMPALSFIKFTRGQRIGIVAPPKLQGDIRLDGLFLDEFLDSSHATWVITGGLLKSFAPTRPLGFLKVDGETLNAPSPDQIGRASCRERV